MSAAEGSISDATQILSLLRGTPAVPHPQLFLPVCWANLDPLGIPGPAELEILVSTPQLGHFLMRPLVYLEIVHSIKEITERALADLWPRAWAWMSFISTYREVLPSAPPEHLVGGALLQFIIRVPLSIIERQPEVHIMVSRVWAAFISTDTDTPGFGELCVFLGYGIGELSPTQVSEYVEGAGGNLYDLASLVVKHLALASRFDDPFFIRCGIIFVSKVEQSPDGPFHAALRAQGFFGLLAKVLHVLPRMFEHENAQDTLRECTAILVAEFRRATGYLSIPEALRSGLLRAIIPFCTNLAPESEVPYLSALLSEFLQPSTMYYSVLQALEEVLPEAEARVATFPGTPMSRSWSDFVIHAKRRLDFKRHFDSEDYVPSN
ncbi:hypothetical protein FB451DRAFT_1556730, partial [Mycena latifolia]